MAANGFEVPENETLEAGVCESFGVVRLHVQEGADGLGTGSKWDVYWADSGLAEGRKSWGFRGIILTVAKRT